MAGQSEPASTAAAASLYSCSGSQRLSSCHGNCWAPLQTQSRASEVGYHTLEPSKRQGGSKGYTRRSTAPRTEIISLRSDFCLRFCTMRSFCLALFISMFGAQSEETANPLTCNGNGKGVGRKRDDQECTQLAHSLIQLYISTSPENIFVWGIMPSAGSAKK